MPRTSKNPAKNTALLTAALEGLELQRARLNEQIAEVKALLNKRGPRKAAAADEGPAPKRKRRKLSAAARARIAAAQKKRWAEFRKESAA
jgi:hypothetical protein